MSAFTARPRPSNSEIVIKRPNSAQHIPELDGIRGLAIALVIMYHFGGFEGRGPLEKLLSSVFGFGWSGVDLFFVLSGFLITNILLETKTCTNYFRIFYLRRVLRIFPLYFLVIFIFFHVVVPVAHSHHKLLVLATQTEPWYWIYLANWPIGHHNSISVLVPYWSLSVEEQFYAVWPMVVFLSSRKVLACIAAAIIATAFVLRCVYSPSPGGIFVYVWTPLRMDALALGALCGLVYRNREWSAMSGRWLTPLAASAAVMLILIFVWSGTTSGDAPPIQRYGFLMLGVLYSCLVLSSAIGSQSGSLSRVLTAKPLVRLGTVSYGVYVLHYFFVFLLGALVPQLRPLSAVPTVARSFLLIVVGGGLSYGVAEVSWRLFEKPILRLKRRYQYSHTTSVSESPNRDPRRATGDGREATPGR
jgi:peptidoglycan/LPS O-acetylase OafA/YrhL